MADYQLTATESSVIRTADGACIPNDPANRDYAEYTQWLEDGGVPDPYVPPEPGPSQPTEGQALAFDHENRILALEGQPPLSVADFIAKAQQPQKQQAPLAKKRK
jgi:hypothetical protein